MGLGHGNTGQQIMDPDVLTINARKVKNSTVCTAFRTVFPATCKYTSTGTDSCICSLVLPAARQAAPSRKSDEAEAQEAMLEGGANLAAIPIEKLAQSFIVDRMPVEVEDYYGQQDVDVLEDMLGDPANAEYALTIVTLIGLISYGADEEVLAISDYRGRGMNLL